MKKLYQGTIALLCFSLSITIFQLSCKKSANAGPVVNSTSTTQQNKIVYTKDFYGGPNGNGGYDSAEIWTANYDGTDPQKLNIQLPTGYVVVLNNAIRMSPDSKTIFFDAEPTNSSGTWSIYACNIDGSNAHLVVAGSTSNAVEAAAAY